MSARFVLQLFCVLGGDERKSQGICVGWFSVHRFVDGSVKVSCDQDVKENKLAVGFSLKRESDAWFY